MSAKTSFLKLLDRTVGAALCAALARPQRTPETRTLSDLPPGGRILVVRPGGIGDAVLLLPALRGLREAVPDRALDVVCESRNAGVFRLAGIADRLFEFDAHPFRTLAALRRGPWAAVLDTEQFHHFSAVFAVLSRAPVRIGFAINPARLGLYTHLVPYDTQGPERDQFSNLVARACPSVRPSAAPFGRIPPAPPGLPPRFVLCHAGGSSESKRWPARTFAAFCRIASAETGWPCVLAGGKGDAAYAREVAGLFSAGRPPSVPAILDRTGLLSLEETAAACRAAAVLVGPDSGLAHLAAAVGTPSVVLFGPSDPGKWGPPSCLGTAVRTSPPCAPCSMFGATKPCRGRDCMRAIAAETVWHAVRSLLDHRKGPGPEPG